MKHITIATFAAVSAISTLAVAQPSYTFNHRANVQSNVVNGNQFIPYAECCGDNTAMATTGVPINGLGVGVQLQVSGDQSCCDAYAGVYAYPNVRVVKEITFRATPLAPSGFNRSNFFVEVYGQRPNRSYFDYYFTLANGGIQTNGVGYKLRTGNGQNSIPLGSTIEYIDFELDSAEQVCVSGMQTAFLQYVAIDKANVGVLQNETAMCGGGSG